MKKLRNIVLFITTLLAIFLLDFVIYKNIDKLIPKHQNELQTFENNSKESKADFLQEMCEQIESTDNYRRVLKETQIIEENTILYNLIKSYVYSIDIQDEDILNIISDLDIGDLPNTIYGNLKFVTSRYIKYVNSKKKNIYTNYYIAYSEDMKKICYYNLDEKVPDYDSSNTMATMGVLEDEEFYETQGDSKTPSEQNKEKIIKDVKEEFSKAIPTIEFTPNIITYKNGMYILEDETKDIVIYYNSEMNNIFGFYIGFNI